MNSEKNTDFSIGTIVFFNELSSIMVRFYGARIFKASIDAKTVTFEEFLDGEFAINPLKNNSSGMVLGSCFVETHGNGTKYYKVLFGDHLLWVASAHLRSNL